MKAVYIQDYGNVYVDETGTFVLNKKMKKLFVYERLGYYRIRVWYTREDGKRGMHFKGIHTLVAMAYIDNPHGHKEVNHKDGNKHNNHVSNLEWCSRSENIRHAFAMGLNVAPHGETHHKAKLTEDNVKDIFRRWKMGASSMSELAREYGVTHTAIECIVHRTTWKHLTL